MRAKFWVVTLIAFALFVTVPGASSQEPTGTTPQTNAATSAQVDSLSQQVKEATSKLEEAQRNQERIKAKLNDLGAEANTANTNAAALREQLTTANTQISSLTANINSLNERIRKQNEANEKLRNELIAVGVVLFFVVGVWRHRVARARRIREDQRAQLAADAANQKMKELADPIAAEVRELAKRVPTTTEALNKKPALPVNPTVAELREIAKTGQYVIPHIQRLIPEPGKGRLAAGDFLCDAIWDPTIPLDHKSQKFPKIRRHGETIERRFDQITPYLASLAAPNQAPVKSQEEPVN